MPERLHFPSRQHGSEKLQIGDSREGPISACLSGQPGREPFIRQDAYGMNAGVLLVSQDAADDDGRSELLGGLSGAFLAEALRGLFPAITGPGL